MKPAVWVSAENPAGFASSCEREKPVPVSVPLGARPVVNGPSEQPVLVRTVAVGSSAGVGFGKAIRGGPFTPAAVSWMCVAVLAGLWYGVTTLFRVMFQQMTSSSEFTRNSKRPVAPGCPTPTVPSVPTTCCGVASTTKALVKLSGGSTGSGVSAEAVDPRAPRVRVAVVARTPAPVHRVARFTVMVVPSS